ncbi:polyamine ABC transporter substrate-binding protein [Leucobacter triazinivorans]|uniref:Spermidine/putrescine ABC transporter substrate-binding protein n=1 Tax=Leucobacter triazinivorans TaxID=1784719 RepID=A0A4P6KC69_9MICO|nr:spermidine/putrescine ABC transporter substrate-binding protein [Leucobacter triazinivorans]QBE47925.1 spermidine/putrescine ABC transporter substrate-binding protein [Leucobacter triazinivorans]
MARQPEDPIVRSIVNMIRGAQVSRRQLLRGAAVGAAGAGTLGLASCAGGSGGGGGGGIVWGNWTYYLDFDEATGGYPSLDAFVEQAGFSVDYIEDIDDNNTFYGKIKDQLAQDQFTGYDVITLTDWMNGRLLEAGQIQEFDYANLPTVTANLIDAQWDALDVDPGRKFTIPWQLPASGWVWQKDVDPIRELDDFLRPDLHGKVGVLSEMRDTMGMIMAGLGTDPAGDWGDAEFDAALAWLDDALKSGQIANVKGNSYTQDLQTGTTLAAMAWTGDVATLNAENGDQWVLEVPESGGMITADSFTVPNGTSAENKAMVEEMIDYYYDPAVAAQVADYVWFVTPVKGAQEEMEKINPDNVDNPLIFPDDDMQSRLHNFRTLTAEEDNKYSTLFQGVLGL